MKKAKIMMLAVGAVSVALAVAAFIVLPEQVAMQLGSNGLQNYAPKYLAVLLPLVLSGIGIAMMVKEESFTKGCVIGWIGPVLQVLTLVMNLA